MHKLESEHFFCRPSIHCFVVLKHEIDKVIVVEKGDRLLFVFNLHPWKTYENYRVGTFWRGKYEVVLDSDSWDSGGGGRVSWDHKPETQEEGWNGRPTSLFVKIPPRSCQVYRCYEWYDEPAPVEEPIKEEEPAVAEITEKLADIMETPKPKDEGVSVAG